MSDPQGTLLDSPLVYHLNADHSNSADLSYYLSTPIYLPDLIKQIPRVLSLNRHDPGENLTRVESLQGGCPAMNKQVPMCRGK